MDVTKDASLPTWEAAAHAYLQHLRDDAELGGVLISVADKTHNLLSILHDHELLGDAVWDRFHATKHQQQWWYNSVLEVAQERLPDNPLTANLGRLVAQLDLL